jgi:hypothetical protein
MDTQFKISNLLVVMITCSGYASLSGCQTLTQASVAVIAIAISLLWLVFSVGVARTGEIGDAGFTFRMPTIVFIFGFAMFFAGMILFFPTAESITLENLKIASDTGYQAHYEEHDFIVAGMCAISVVLGLPVVLLVGICATFPSQKFGLHGLSRYSMAYFLALTPLIFGMLMMIDYAQKAWHFQGAG